MKPSGGTIHPLKPRPLLNPTPSFRTNPGFQTRIPDPESREESSPTPGPALGGRGERAPSPGEGRDGDPSARDPGCGIRGLEEALEPSDQPFAAEEEPEKGERP